MAHPISNVYPCGCPGTDRQCLLDCQNQISYKSEIHFTDSQVAAAGIELSAMILGAFWGGWWGVLAGFGFGGAAGGSLMLAWPGQPRSTVQTVGNVIGIGISGGLGYLGYTKAKEKKAQAKKNGHRRRLGRKGRRT